LYEVKILLFDFNLYETTAPTHKQEQYLIMRPSLNKDMSVMNVTYW